MSKEKEEKQKNKIELYEEEVLSEEDVRKNVVKNLNYLKYKYRDKITSQNKLAELLGIGAPLLTKILQGQHTPTVYPFLANIKKWFHYSIDEFLYTDIEATERIINGDGENLPMASCMKFVGLYQMYYFDTSAFKGRERAEDNKALKSGIMYVERDTTDRYTVAAIFNLRKELADALYQEAYQRGRGRVSNYIKQYIMSLDSSQHVYYGEMELSSKHVYVSLRFENTKDRVQMIFLRPESNKSNYIGGLGTMVSVSKGRLSVPCLQYIGVADTSLNVSEEEMAAHLLMSYPSLKTRDSIDELANFTADLYDNSGEHADRLSRLSNENKKALIQNYLDKIVNETVERNLFRTVVVSAVDDDDFYHYVKRVKRNMGQEVR